MSLIYHQFSNRNLEQALSLERMERYTDWAGKDREKALYLYGLNTSLSESLYTPLQMLEVTMRNRFHTVLTETHGENWFELPGFLANARQNDQLQKARKEIEDSKKPYTAGRIVAELTFGFWTALVGRQYEDLWQTTLHKAAHQEGGKGITRKQFSTPLHPIRELRNRVAHHEPILHWTLEEHYQNILRITRWLCPDAADWCEHHSRFLSVYQAQPIELIKDSARL